jgi:C-terminal processing protease CtpA/Prc
MIVALGIGAASSGAAAAAKVPESRTVRNWHAFTRLYGYVRWFHPSDEAAATDWDGFAILGARRVRDAANDAELRRVLVDLFVPIAPSLLVFETGKAPPPEAITAPADSPRVAWQHLGVGAGATSPSSGFSPYRSVRVNRDPARLFDSLPGAVEMYEHELVSGLRCRFALTLPSVGDHTLPSADVFALGRLRAEIDGVNARTASADDEAVRVAGIAVLWNLTQHFWPYFDVVHPDWEGALDRALTRTLQDRTGEDYAHTLWLMTALLEDGHVAVRVHNHPAYGSTGLVFQRAEGRVVVSDSGDSLARRGDLVRSIDGRAAKALMDSAMATRSGTESWRRFASLRALDRGASGTIARLEVERGGKVSTFAIPRSEKPVVPPRTPDPVAQIEPGIWYVDLARSRMSQIDSVMTDLAQAKGVVFDARGYPNGTHLVLPHLTDSPMQSAIWRIPRTIRPDRIGPAEWDESGRWNMPPLQPRLKGRMVFLIGSGAISYAESVMGIVEAYHLGELVGEATAGCNGNINRFALPGGIEASWTGMRVLKHDGSEHMGVGIKPSVPVALTIAGIRSGRDEVLERGVEIARGTRTVGKQP